MYVKCPPRRAAGSGTPPRVRVGGTLEPASLRYQRSVKANKKIPVSAYTSKPSVLVKVGPRNATMRELMLLLVDKFNKES